MGNHRFKVTPHVTWTLAGANIHHRSLEPRIVVLGTIQQVANSAMLLWELVINVLSISNQRDVGIVMLGCVVLKGYSCFVLSIRFD